MQEVKKSGNILFETFPDFSLMVTINEFQSLY